jgi:serine/threonine protein kinase
VLESGALPDGRPYIVMELVSGDTLRTVLRRRGRLSPLEMMQILEPTCSALAAAHAAGVVHRDLKGSNISVGEGEGGPVVNLLDFGIAKLTQDDPSMPGLTVKGSRLGTPYAMAPEQIRGDEVDERADIYSLGVLVFQMLTGSYPFSAPSAHELERLHLEAVPPRPSRMAPVASAIEAVIIRCLEKRPEARFRTVAEFLDALRTAVAGQPTAVAADDRPAVAISVEVSAPEGDGQPGSPSADDLAEDLETVWDIAEQTLREAGFELPLVTGNLIVAARLLPGDPQERHRQTQAALRAAQEVRRRVDDRAGAQPSLMASIGLHVGPAQVQGSPPSERVAGGAILQVAAWGLDVDLDGVRATREAAADLA